MFFRDVIVGNSQVGVRLVVEKYRTFEMVDVNLIEFNVIHTQIYLGTYMYFPY